MLARIGISADVSCTNESMPKRHEPAWGSSFDRWAMTNPLPELLKLSVAERIQLVEDIWDSIAAEASAVEPSDEIGDELHRRLDDQAANPAIGHSWPEVKARLLSTARDADISERLNSLYGQEPEGLSPDLPQAQAASVAKLDGSREDAAS
jgi:putative addiction module component (TIGR02574 family)